MSLFLNNYSLESLNTFGLQVRAARFAAPSTTEELAEAYADVSPGEKVLIIGEGSNLLFLDDFDGLIIKPLFRGISLKEETKGKVLVEAGAAENWDKWVETSIGHGWYGLENLSLIPGTVGAAPVQNIGAYGRELKDFFHELEAWDMEEGRVVRLKGPECKFSYRNSIFKSTRKGRYVITRVIFRLSTEPRLHLVYGQLEKVFSEEGGSGPEDLRKLIMEIRRSKLPEPEDAGNAGSFFKNPVIATSQFQDLQSDYPKVPYYPDATGMVKIPAAWLIEQTGWKGKRVGEVGTWPQQPLVIVNYGKATGREIYDFSACIMDAVMDRFSISLEREVNVV